MYEDEDMVNSERPGDIVDQLAIGMRFLGLSSPVLSSAESYNTVEVCTLDEEDVIDANEIVNDMLTCRAAEPAEDEDAEDAAWVSCGNDLRAHRGLFSHGILAAQSYHLRGRQLLAVNSNSFAISSSNSRVVRIFKCCTRGEFLSRNITLILVENLPDKRDLKQHKVYIQQQGNQLVYAVMLDKKRVVGTLENINIATELSQEFLDNHKFAILNNIYKNGHIKNSNLMNIESLLNELKQFLEYQPNSLDISNIIVNSKRTEETFFPVIINDASRELGFYVYPWMLGNIKDFKFSGFTRFVTAGCMFGTSIKAVDHHDWSCNLIKHNLPFSSQEQTICDIQIESLVSCYEQTLFSEFDKLLLLVDKLSKQECKKQIYYHLPCYDYILFGVELFNKNRIELPALNKFFEAVLNKKEEHVNNISKICSKHGIDCVIESPFENLFDYSALVAKKNNRRQQKECLLAKHVLLSLDMCDPSVSYKDESEYPKYTDAQLNSIILKKLISNKFNAVHQEVWEDFFTAIQDPELHKLDNIDDLFKIANGIMVAIACKDQQDYKVCALHTLSEKPISVTYGGLRNSLKKAKENQDLCAHKFNKYGSSFNMTVMEPVLGYSTSCNGLLFYFPNSKSYEFSDLINNREILSHMHRNIADITLNRGGTSLHEALLPRL